MLLVFGCEEELNVVVVVRIFVVDDDDFGIVIIG